MSLRRFPTLCAFFLCVASCRSDPRNSQLNEIDSGLRLSIHFIAGQNAAVYTSLQQKLADPTTRDLSNLWSPPALKVQMLSARAIGLIDSLHSKMATIGWISKEDEKSLFDTLVNCKRDLLNVFPDSLDPYSQFLAEDRESLKRHFPLLPYSSVHGQPDLTFAEWSDLLFKGGKSMIALSLDKLEVDVLLSEQEIVKYCDKHVESTVDRYDIFAPLVTLNRSVVAPGDTIELTAGIGTYLSSAGLKATIAGVSVPTYSGGLVLYNFRASTKPGQYSIPVRIEYTPPYGHRNTVDRDVRYQVSNLRAQ